MWRLLIKFVWQRSLFIFDIIYCSKDVKHCLEVMEPYFIEHYDTFKNGYNAHSGGKAQIGFKLSNEAKIKIGLSHKGRKIKDSARNAISKSWKVIFPDGREEIVFNLVPFCQEHNLQVDLMYSVAKGNSKSNINSKYIRTHHKGFKCAAIESNVR